MLSDVINNVDRALENQANLNLDQSNQSIEATETSNHSNSKENSPKPVPRTQNHGAPATNQLDNSETGQMQRVLNKTKEQLQAFGISFDPITGNVEKISDPKSFSPMVPKLAAPNVGSSIALPAAYQRNLMATFEGASHQNQHNHQQFLPHPGNNNLSMHVNALAMKYLVDNNPSGSIGQAMNGNGNSLSSPRSILRNKVACVSNKVTFAETHNQRQVIEVQPYNYQPSSSGSKENEENLGPRPHGSGVINLLR